MKTRVERTIADRTLSFETGELARQAGGAVIAQYGESVVLATAVAVEDRRNVPFFPLTMEYREKQYAAGQFPGGIIKREGRPTTKETLTCRLMDRPIRPLFPDDYHEDVQVIAWVLSSDGENDPDVLAMNAASAALAISDIPFLGPIGSSRVGLAGDEFVLNPLHEQRENAELDIVVSSRSDSVVMVEGSAHVIPEDDLVTAIGCAHDANVEVVALIRELVELCGKAKRSYEPYMDLSGVMDIVRTRYRERVAEARRTPGKLARAEAVGKIQTEAIEELCDPEDQQAPSARELSAAFDQLENELLREQVLKQRVRVDGRAFDEVRAVTCRVAVLPRTHGSAVFTRGETQALAVATLGTVHDEQRILDPLVEEPAKKFMLHYNFPPFSVGEMKPIRGPGRREIGHGELAERALRCVLPDSETFPYTIRIVADILESNGSSSMASVCGGTLCLMDAGVPISQPVAGVTVGLIKQGDESILLTDIAGSEDHHGDMDMKVAGTQHGVTSVQMDLKVTGVGVELLRRALNQAREGRMQILRAMLQTLDRPRPDTSPYAPMLVKVMIDPDLIGKLIGPGGKTIKGLEEKYECTIEVEDDGSVTVSSERGGRADEAAQYIRQLGQKIEVGTIYDGVVTDLKDFGAIVELFPGADGLCHISQLDEGYVKEVTDVCKVGDRIPVKVLSVEDNRVRLSRKAALQERGET